MAYLSQIVFIIILGIAGFLFAKRVKFIARNIKLGRDVELADNKADRFKTMMLVAFGQQKMFKRILPAVMHLAVYVAFVVTQVELIEILVDGVIGGHRSFWYWFDNSFFRGFYTFMINFIEILSVAATVATIVFLARRNLLKVPRFVKPEMKGWPELDGNLILVFELWLLACIFTMNSADVALHQNEYSFIISGFLAQFLDGFSNSTLHILERAGWWGHIIGVFVFLVYVTYSKHLHIILAFPNTYFSRLSAKGYMPSMPEITKEIQLMMNPDTAFAAPAEGEAAEIPTFGAKDVKDLSWKSLMEAYTCTECGRCTSSCPANMTGKLLSPRKIMMDTRDRLEEVGKNMDANGGEFKDDGKTLLHDYISVEELRACTTCNACVEECPINISPLNIILDLRRNLIMEESNSPQEWNLMFTNIENNGAPWQFSPSDRDKWITEA